MNGLEEIREYVENFVVEKGQVQKQIGEIEQKRIKLAQQRNEKKKVNSNDATVHELGRQICELGNQSQELQRKLDFKTHEIKEQVSLMMDSILLERIRKICKINEEINELEKICEKQKETSQRYQLQRQEFFVRFGRLPELSESAKNEIELQEKQTVKAKLEINEMLKHIDYIEEQSSELKIIKKQLNKGLWDVILKNKEITVEELIKQETAEIEELKGAENINKEFTIEDLIEQEPVAIAGLEVEEMGDIEELYIEEFTPIEEIVIEEFKPDELIVEEFAPEEQMSVIDEIEELARNIVEEIAAEQTRDYSNKIEEDKEEDIIFEKVENAPKSKVIIPLFGKNATISTIIVKIEDGQLVYKAQMSDEEDIVIYPAKLSQDGALLRDKQNRAECAEILRNYAIDEYKTFDKKVIKQIDPLVCELLIECAKEYGYNAQNLIYNYAMSFSNNVGCDIENVPAIIYNLSYIETSNLSQKERVIIKKICKNARKNEKIDTIESFTGYKKIKYVLKRIFAINNVNVLPEGNINKN